jgi:ankyrin repeat protein
VEVKKAILLILIFCKDVYCNSLPAASNHKKIIQELIQKKQQKVQNNKTSVAEALERLRDHSNLDVLDSVVDDFDKAGGEDYAHFKTEQSQLTDKKATLSNYSTILACLTTILSITGMIAAYTFLGKYVRRSSSSGDQNDKNPGNRGPTGGNKVGKSRDGSSTNPSVAFVNTAVTSGERSVPFLLSSEPVIDVIPPAAELVVPLFPLVSATIKLGESSVNIDGVPTSSDSLSPVAVTESVMSLASEDSGKGSFCLQSLTIESGEALDEIDEELESSDLFSTGEGIELAVPLAEQHGSESSSLQGSTIEPGEASAKIDKKANGLGIQLIDAIRRFSNIDRIKDLIAQGANINVQDDDMFYRPLDKAVTVKEIEVINVLLDEGANIDAQGQDGFTPLCQAVENWEAHGDNTEIIDLLLEKGADINGKDSSGLSFLHRAVSDNKMHVVNFLLERGATRIDIDIKDINGDTPLCCAVFNNNAEIVKLLLENGADSNVQNDFGNTPFHKAAFYNSVNVVDLLVGMGINVGINVKNKDGNTPLHVVKSKAMVNQFLNAGADINAQNILGMSPLHQAVVNGNIDVIHALLDRSAYIDAKDKCHYTPLYWAIVFRNRNPANIVDLLLKRGADVNARGYQNSTLLHWVIWCRVDIDIDIVKLLLDRGADINIPNCLGQTPLELAKALNREEIIDLFSQYGSTLIIERGLL